MCADNEHVQYQDSEKKKPKSKNDELVETAKKRFNLAVEAEAEIREVGKEDLLFRAGQQWPDNIKAEREADARPCLVINRIPQFVRQVTNDQRQNRPSIKVHPVDDRADIETAKIFQGMVRHIEYNSGADVAYDTAVEGVAIKGWGYFRVLTDFIHPESFDQEILIKQIEDDFCVYMDPNSKEPDGSDANWCFIVEDMPKEDYLAEFGESDLAGDWEHFSDSSDSWATKDSVRIAEYFYKEFEDDEICLLKNGRSIRKKYLDDLIKTATPEEQDDLEVMETRKTKIPVIKWCKLNGCEVLDETTWPGRWIPIVRVLGDKLVIEGKRTYEGLIRHAKDSQRMYNYWASTETEAIALAPRAPYIAAEGQIPPAYEHIWKTANRQNHAYLPYKPTSHQGALLPPPQRNNFEPPIAAVTTARLNAAEDLKATTGIYDAALGNRSNETSGVAIKNRAHQAQTSNFHIIDNLTRSIRHCGRIVVDLIPKIYDTARAARIIGEEGEQEVIRINEEFQYKGQKTFFDLGKGKYDVVVETGPSFATKREEAALSMMEFVRANPQAAGLVMDLIAKNQDWPGAEEFAERFRKTLPSEVAEDEGQQQIPQQAKAQMAQMSQMIEQLTQQLNEANEEIRTKAMDLNSKEKIAAMKAETDLLKELLQQSQAGARFQVESQLQELELQQQNLNGSGSQGSTPQNQNMPTGGQAPGFNT